MLITSRDGGRNWVKNYLPEKYSGSFYILSALKNKFYVTVNALDGVAFESKDGLSWVLNKTGVYIKHP